MIDPQRSIDSSHALALDPDDLEELAELPAVSPSIVERLGSYGILPPDHRRLSERVLARVEQLFVTWYELADDDARRAALHYLLTTEADVRSVLLAIAPIYYDRMFFDEKTPTKTLVDLALIAHGKWRRWLESSSAARI
jgi:hypothetical protein